MTASTSESNGPINSKLLVPSFPRKKAVTGVFRPNSYRVLFEDAEFARPRSPLAPRQFEDHLSRSHSLPPANRAPRPSRDLRHHNPQPWTASFLRENVSTMLVPVCHVSTHNARDEQHCWWINDSGSVSHSKPQFSLDSTTRAAYGRSEQPPARAPSLRPKFTEAANGIVPANPLWEKSGSVRVWREGLSYEQQYDSRHRDNYPVRGRRHGALVLARDAGGSSFLESSGLPATRAAAADSDARAAEANADVRPPGSDKSLSRLPFRAPNSVPYHRQHVRRPRLQEETVASLMQPEFRFRWNQPQPEPFFTS